MRGRSERADKYSRQEYVFGSCAAAALYRTGMLRDVGLFDEDFYLLYEDVDLSFRAQLRGYKCLYVPNAIVVHKGSGSIIRDSPLSVYFGHRNLEWVYLKNMPISLIPRTILFHLLYNFGAFLYFVGIGRGRHFVRAKVDAVKGIRPMLNKRRKIQRQKRVENKYIWSLMTREIFVDGLRRMLLRNPS
jgi:GT2 family glycosyltransferase